MSESLTQLRALRAGGAHTLVGIRAMPGTMAPVAVLHSITTDTEIQAIYVSLEDAEDQAYALRWMTCMEEQDLA